jgi:hypothetical protein
MMIATTDPWLWEPPEYKRFRDLFASEMNGSI